MTGGAPGHRKRSTSSITLLAKNYESLDIMTRRISFLKALTYRVLSIILVMLMVYLFTGHIGLAASIGAMDALLKISLYYLHERVWVWGLEKWGKK